MNVPYEGLPEWFFKQLEVHDDCWVWTKAVDGGGYGSLKIMGEIFVKAHRLSWFLVHGKMPNGGDKAVGGNMVLHRCDKPPCCRPSHLFSGTQKDNVQDCASKRRRNQWRSNLCKLTEQQAKEIFTSSESNKALCAKYSVTRNAIWRIKAKQTWAHIHAG